MSTLKSKIPPIYHHLLPSIFDKTIPQEKIATCNNCLYQLSPNHVKYHTKCCDYFPYLPNYLVGGILQDDNPLFQEGKERILEKIKNQQGVTPYGIFPDTEYKTTFNRSRTREKSDNHDKQTEANSLLCPYYQDGLCTILPYRDYNCFSFYCHSSAGAVGKSFWNNVKQYFKSLQLDLTNYTIKQQNINLPIVENFKIINHPDFEQNTTYEQFWQNWEGKEIDFYKGCYQLIQQLTIQEFSALKREVIVSQEGILEQSILNFKSSLIPERLILNPKVVLQKIDTFNWQITLDDYSEQISLIHLPFLLSFKRPQSLKKIIDEGYKKDTILMPTFYKLYDNDVLIKNNR